MSYGAFETGLDLSGIDPPSHPLAVPTERAGAPVVPRYRIIRLIGEGGMGAVWEAEQASPCRRVALKVIRPGWLNATLVKRFEYEVHVLGRLRHPGIAQIYEAGLLDTPLGRQPFFAMELIEGVRLDEYVRQTRPPLRERLDLLARVCDAVQHAHFHGIIHRDLKPANILVTEDGQPKILDFGVARATEADLQTTTLHTDPGQLVGTLQYMSPEQASGHAHELDTRSDVYALGVLAFEMIADRRPYELANLPLDEAIRIIRVAPCASLSIIDRTLRGDVETIVGKALEKEKDRRYATAADLGADVRRFLNYEPITARAPSAWYQLSRFARRNKVLVGAAAVVRIALAGGMTATTVQYFKARRAEGYAQAQRQLAQQRYDDVRELAGKLIGDLFVHIQSLPGSTPAKRLLAETSFKHLAKLEADAGGDPQLLGELALAYGRVGLVQASTGNLTGALESYRRWEQINQGLVNASPGNMKRRANLAKALMFVGDTLDMTGDADAALRAHGRAMALLQEVRATQPDDLKVLSDLWFAMRYVGDLLRKTGDTAGAAQVYHDALDVCRRAAAVEPGNLTLQNNLANCHQRIARSLVDAGDFTGARTQLLEALGIHQRTAQADPVNVQLRHSVAAAHLKLGDLLIKAGEATEALAHLEQSRLGFQVLADADPDQVEALLPLALANNLIGTARRNSGDDAGALASFRAALALSKRVTARDPADLVALRDVAEVQLKLGGLLAASGDVEGAVEHHQNACASFQRIARAAATATAVRDAVVSQSALADSHVRRAACAAAPREKRLADWRAAASLYRDALATLDDPPSRAALLLTLADLPAHLRQKLDRCERELAALPTPDALPATQPVTAGATYRSR